MKTFQELFLETETTKEASQQGGKQQQALDRLAATLDLDWQSLDEVDGIAAINQLVGDAQTLHQGPPEGWERWSEWADWYFETMGWEPAPWEVL